MALSWPLVLQLLAVLSDAPVELWNYDNPALWANFFPMCGGPLQSPIDLTPGTASANDHITLEMAPGLQQGEIEAINTGRTARLYFRPENQSAPIVQYTLANRPLFGTYRFEHMDLHWTESIGSETGSEHSIAGRLADAEAQLVFYNTRYASLKEALRHPGGVSILAILLTSIEPPGTPTFPTFELETQIESLAMKGSMLTHGVDLSAFESMLRSALAKTYSYYGSITIPPCSPVVNWMVAASEMTASLEFLTQLNNELFEDLLMQKLLVNNRRPTQKNTGRKVLESFNIVA